MPTVKKWGQYWYPASLVGFKRGIEFAYDHATNTLYADGSKLDLDSLVVDGVVYIPLQPDLSMSDMNPGMRMLETRRGQYEAYEETLPERRGNTEALFMENSVEVPAHPWAEAPTAQPEGPIIDLDPTGNARVPSHMGPHALPQQGTPETLPGHLPRPLGPPPSEPSPSASYQIPPSPQQGIPLRVSTQGGPQGGSEPDPGVTVTLPPPSAPPSNTEVTSRPNGLQPIPVAANPQPPGPVGMSPGGISPSRGKNQAFEVSVLSGSLKEAGSDRLLSLTLNQTNLSPVAQSNLGSFALRCRDGSRVESVKSRSVMPDGTLAPGGVREGELLFRLPAGAQPAALELEGTLPLSVPLGR